MNKKKIINQHKKGFTLVELMLSMSFVSILLITIAIITVNILTIYQKGLAIKTVNAVGRELTDEFTNALNVSPSVDTKSLCGNTRLIKYEYRDACRQDKASNFVFQQTIDSSPTAKGSQLNGVFCTGKYSYIWNTPAGEAKGRTLSLTYDGGSGYASGFRMIRVNDRTYEVCAAVTSDDYKSMLKTENVSNINITQLKGSSMPNPIPPAEDGFLEKSDIDLELYELVIYPISQDLISLRTFMTGSFILATDEGINLSRSGSGPTGDYCRNINDQIGGGMSIAGSDFNYCAINKFNFAGHTAGI